jgi:hypothetical protein
MIIKLVRQGLVYSSIVVEEIYHFYTAAAAILDVLEELCTIIDAAWETYLQDDITLQMTWTGWTGTRVDLPSQPSYELAYQGISDGAGDAAGTPMPAQVTLPINFYAVATFPRRGRKNVGVWTETANTSGGLPTTDAKNHLANFGDAILAISMVNTYATYIVSPKYTLTPPRVTDYNQLVSLKVADRWGTLRSRRT